MYVIYAAISPVYARAAFDTHSSSRYSGRDDFQSPVRDPSKLCSVDDTLHSQEHGRLHVIPIHTWIVDSRKVPHNFALGERKLEVHYETRECHLYGYTRLFSKVSDMN